VPREAYTDGLGEETDASHAHKERERERSSHERVSTGTRGNPQRETPDTQTERETDCPHANHTQREKRETLHEEADATQREKRETPQRKAPHTHRERNTRLLHAHERRDRHLRTRRETERDDGETQPKTERSHLAGDSPTHKQTPKETKFVEGWSWSWSIEKKISGFRTFSHQNKNRELRSRPKTLETTLEPPKIPTRWSPLYMPL
jgi:hypothetical protein